MSLDRFATIRRVLYGKTQKVAYTGTAGTISNPLPSQCPSVRVVLSTAGYVKVGYGSGLAATTSDHYCNANVSYDLPVEPPSRNDADASINQGAFVSAIQDASGGNLFVTPLAD